MAIYPLPLPAISNDECWIYFELVELAEKLQKCIKNWDIACKKFHFDYYDEWWCKIESHRAKKFKFFAVYVT